MPTKLISREIRLAERPIGLPGASAFAFGTAAVPEPGPGEVLVRNTWLSVEPYMLERMNGQVAYMPPFDVGATMDGAAIGEVLESRREGVSPGDTVWHLLAWRELALARQDDLVVPVDTDVAPPSAYLGVLGTPGLAAWIGITDIAAVQAGETVFVSAAAGAVGSLAAQIAKLRGARVIGSAGSAAKVEYMTDELGVDVGLNRHDGPIAEQLAAAAPEGIHAAFDNVGGDHLAAAIRAMRPHGRIALCGAIARVDPDTPGVDARTLYEIVVRRVSMRGLLVLDHMDRLAAFREEVGAWLRDGRIRSRETVLDGLDAMPAALNGLYRGENTGKTVIRLDG